MKFFKNRAVAIAVMAAAIILSSLYGISKEPEAELPAGGPPLDDSLSTAIFQQYVVDEAEVLSASTEKHLSLYNANWDQTAGSIMAVVTVESTYGEAEEMAWEWAEKLQLGQDDAILMINTLHQEYSVVASGLSYTKIAAASVSFVDAALYEHVQAGAYDQAALNMFHSMHLLHHGEEAEATPQEEPKEVGILPVILLSGLLLIVCTLLDHLLFRKWHDRYGKLISPPVPYRPTLWWHRPGSDWYRQRRDAEKKRASRPGPRPPSGGRPTSSGGSRPGAFGGGSFGGGSRGGSFGGGSRSGSFGGGSRSGSFGGGSRSGSFGGGSRSGSFGGGSRSGSFGGGSRSGSFGGGSRGGSFGGGSRSGSFGGGSRSGSFGGGSRSGSFGGGSRSGSFGGGSRSGSFGGGSRSGSFGSRK